MIYMIRMEERKVLMFPLINKRETGVNLPGKEDCMTTLILLKFQMLQTVYDFLILSLTEKDVIATFNWDPLLLQAYVRCNEITDNLPHLLCLHGNVGTGYCEEHREFGSKDAVCPYAKNSCHLQGYYIQ